jgi:hypothetical protein
MTRLRLNVAICSILVFAFTAGQVFTPAVVAAGIVPAGSRVFMTVTGNTNICGPADENHNSFCAVTAGPTVPLIFPTTTFTDPRGAEFGYITASEDVMTGKTMHATLNAKSSDFQYLSINDTYTVHGTASGSFPITVTFRITGTFGSMPNASLGNFMANEASQLEIGTFHPEATLTQFVIDPFPADAQNPMMAQVTQTHGAQASPTPLTFPWDVQVSYTKLVSVNDVFDFAYGLDMNVSGSAQMDLNPNGLDVISFALPTGVFLTSALGATFGTSPSLVGDYNNNGTVDAADYVVWRKNDGTTTSLPNDPIGGTIGPAQYDNWRAHFGQTPGSGTVASANASVPEPATLVLLTLAAAIGISSEAGLRGNSRQRIDV